MGEDSTKYLQGLARARQIVAEQLRLDPESARHYVLYGELQLALCWDEADGSETWHAFVDVTV